jgi:hypothetical protein
MVRREKYFEYVALFGKASLVNSGGEAVKGKNAG